MISIKFYFCVPGICPEPVSSGQNVPGSQDTVLWHWSLSVLCHDWIWFNRISHCRILLKGKTVSRYKKRPNTTNNRLAKPQKAKKKWDSEPRAGKSSEKWVKSREMSQISYWKDFQGRLWVLEVTYHFKAEAVDIMINFMS